MIHDEANIVRVAVLDRVKSEAEANDRLDNKFSAKIRARMEARQSERERGRKSRQGLGLRLRRGKRKRG